MARGRMLNKSVSGSIKFHNLPDDTCRLMATWIISNLDIQGVFYGDPTMVRSTIFPRRADITDEQVSGYLEAMQAQRLLVLYEAKGDTWQYWPGFLGEQIGIRADRETTDYPPPPDELAADPWVWLADRGGNNPATIPQLSGEIPAEEKLIEVKRIQENTGASAHPPDFLRLQFEMSVPVIKDMQLTRSQWMDVLQSEKDANGRKTLIKWIDSKLNGGGHPAVATYRDEMEHNPRKNQYGAIIDAIGESGDMDVWRGVVRDWKLYGWNPYNIAGMIDAFRAGGVQVKPHGGNPPPTATPLTDYQNPDEFFAEGSEQ